MYCVSVHLFAETRTRLHKHLKSEIYKNTSWFNKFEEIWENLKKPQMRKMLKRNVFLIICENLNAFE